MQSTELIQRIENFAPPELQEEWDNSGIQIDVGFPQVNKVLTALEINDDVITEAMDEGADWIVTHHPLIFTSTSSVDYRDVTGKYIQRLVRASISVYSAHTSFDAAEGGNNDYLGKLLGFKDIKHFHDDSRYLRRTDLPEEKYFGDIIKDAAEKLGVDLRLFRAVGDPETKIKRIGWCTGAGAEFLQKAFDEGCQLYITGDVKYHDAQKAKALGLCVLDAGHFGTENIFKDNMADVIAKGGGVEVIKSKVDLNPFSW